MSAERLYTPQMLSATVELANFPPLQTAQLHGSARAPACGSTLEMDLDLDSEGAIAAIGISFTASAAITATTIPTASGLDAIQAGLIAATPTPSTSPPAKYGQPFGIPSARHRPSKTPSAISGSSAGGYLRITPFPSRNRV